MQYGKSQEAIDRLTAEQRRVIQEAGTERPFTGEYNDHTEPGIYVDIASGEPLFASSHYSSDLAWEKLAADHRQRVYEQNAREIALVQAACGPCVESRDELRSATGRRKK
jgi:peptide methionine sulfoxide reductase MsrB